MAQIPLALRILLLAALGVHASAWTRPPAILSRGQDFCSANALQRCSNDLSDRFCCPKGSSCLPLAGGTTVLCCPDDRNCDKIQPITCNAHEQDPDKNPKAPIKTSVFDTPLEKCGKNLCCPFGYSCSGSGQECTKNSDQTKPPNAAPSNPSPSTAATSAGPRATGVRTQSAPAESSTAGASSGPDKAAIIGGAVGGSVALLLVVALVIVCIRRRRRPAAPVHGTVISAPVLHPGTYRSDFLRGDPKPRAFPSEPQPPPPAGSGAVQNHHISIPNPFDSPDLPDQSPTHSCASTTSSDELTARTGHVAGARLAPIRAMRASEMRHSRRPDVSREPSGENISVFADPRTMTDDRRMTTFSDMMEQAGFGEVRKGRPYVPGTTPRI